MWLKYAIRRIAEWAGNLNDNISDLYLFMVSSKTMVKNGRSFWINEFKDYKGNLFVIFSNDEMCPQGTTLHLSSAKVKGLREFKGGKTTQLGEIQGLEEVDTSQERVVDYIREILSQQISPAERRQEVFRHFPGIEQKELIELAKGIRPEKPVEAPAQENVEPQVETPAQENVEPQVEAPAAEAPEHRTFKIEDSYLPFVQDKIDKMNRRKKKMGLDLPDITMTIEKTEDVKNPPYHETRPNQVQRFHHVTIDGEIPVYKGWQFLAVIDHSVMFQEIKGGELEKSKSPENLVSKIPGGNLSDEMFKWALTAEPNCDGCGMKRHRLKTYLVENEAGEVKQIGSSCIAKHIPGGRTVEQIGVWGEMLSHMFDDLGMLDEDPEDFDPDAPRKRRRDFIWLTDFMAYVVMSVRSGGWISRAKAGEDGYSTADSAIAAMSLAGKIDPRTHKPYPEPTEEEGQIGDEVINWVQENISDLAYDELLGGLANGNSDSAQYLYGLGQIASRGPRSAIDRRQAGLAASMYTVWVRNTQKPEGEEDKITMEDILAKYPEGTPGPFMLQYVTSNWDYPLVGQYGTAYVHKFVDSDGIKFSWITGNIQKDTLTEGQWYQIPGSIKRYSEKYMSVEIGRGQVGKIKELEMDENGNPIIPDKKGKPKLKKIESIPGEEQLPAVFIPRFHEAMKELKKIGYDNYCSTNTYRTILDLKKMGFIMQGGVLVKIGEAEVEKLDDEYENINTEDMSSKMYYVAQKKQIVQSKLRYRQMYLEYLAKEEAKEEPSPESIRAYKIAIENIDREIAHEQKYIDQHGPEIEAILPRYHELRKMLFLEV